MEFDGIWWNLMDFESFSTVIFLILNSCHFQNVFNWIPINYNVKFDQYFDKFSHWIELNVEFHQISPNFLIIFPNLFNFEWNLIDFHPILAAISPILNSCHFQNVFNWIPINYNVKFDQYFDKFSHWIELNVEFHQISPNFLIIFPNLFNFEWNLIDFHPISAAISPILNSCQFQNGFNFIPII